MLGGLPRALRLGIRLGHLAARLHRRVGRALGALDFLAAAPEHREELYRRQVGELELVAAAVCFEGGEVSGPLIDRLIEQEPTDPATGQPQPGRLSQLLSFLDAAPFDVLAGSEPARAWRRSNHLGSLALPDLVAGCGRWELCERLRAAGHEPSRFDGSLVDGEPAGALLLNCGLSRARAEQELSPRKWDYAESLEASSACVMRWALAATDPAGAFERMLELASPGHVASPGNSYPRALEDIHARWSGQVRSMFERALLDGALVATKPARGCSSRL